MRHLIERLDRAVVGEARKPYVPQSREAQQAVEADLHQEVAEAANAVRRTLKGLDAVLKRAQEKAGQMDNPESTFGESRREVAKLAITGFLERVATDHLRWAKNLRAVQKGE